MPQLPNIEIASTIITKVSALLVNDVADTIGEGGIGKLPVIVSFGFNITITIRT